MHGTSREFLIVVISHAFENFSISQIFSKIINNSAVSQHITLPVPFSTNILRIFVNTFRVNRDERHANH